MKKMTIKTAQELINKQLLMNNDVTLKDASSEQIYKALASIAVDAMLEKRAKYNANSINKKEKVLHYLSIEFLLGKSLRNNLFNLGVDEIFSKVLKQEGKNIDDVYEVEQDAGLGNGGLGRLAACYLDSLSTLGYSVFGHCILYEFGLFKQKIFEGNQIEIPDEWLPTGKVWLLPKEEESVIVRFEGRVKESIGSDGNFTYTYEDCSEVEAVPYDMLIPGYKSDAISILRLWSARSKITLDTTKFSKGEYAQALAQKDEIESISKVLYPADHHEKGKSLRMKQQYFLVSSALQTAIKSYLIKHKNLKHLPKYLILHINDTHPAMAIPELMRILLDEHRLSWEEAWDITCKTINYTNHTILTESLEVWAFDLFERKLPRIAMILREIDRRYRLELAEKGIVDQNLIEKMAIISKNSLRMANLSVVTSHKVNGVAKVHSEILKKDLFNDFYNVEPSKFLNITNGISPRRWLAICNPKLHELIKSVAGDKYLKDPNLLTKFKSIEKNPEEFAKVMKIKTYNKEVFASYLKRKHNIEVDPNTRFDIQVKRIHEYKRQLLNVLKIIYLYSELLENPELDVTPQTFIFAGKAAPGYAMAKRIIHLITMLAKDINSHPEIAKKLKVVFVEDYSVTSSELIMPATDVTEQISLAGREASGTGNMKAVLNGALMICTEDGANIEICDKCGKNNHFSFGLSTDQVDEIWKKGYNPNKYYEQDDRIKTIIKMLNKGFAGESFGDIADYLLWKGGSKDVYMNLADFDSYMKAHYEMDRVYRDKKEWAKKVVHSISAMGYFSSDRSIEQYNSRIWKL